MVIVMTRVDMAIGALLCEDQWASWGNRAHTVKVESLLIQFVVAFCLWE